MNRHVCAWENRKGRMQKKSGPVARFFTAKNSEKLTPKANAPALLRLLRLVRQRKAQQIRHGIHIELFHDVRAVRFNRLDADAEVVGDLLVQAPRDDALEHLMFARGELAQALGGGALLLH